jgi:hypothetical protein
MHSDPIPSAIDESRGSSNMLDEPAFRNATTPEPTMTGRSMNVRRVLYICSACL